MGKKNYAITYTIVGIIFGLCFPVGAIVLDLLLNEMNVSMVSIQTVFTNNPIQFMILSAPLFLGMFAGIGGISRNKAAKAFEDATKALNELKQSELENQNLLQTINEKHNMQSRMVNEISSTTDVLSETGVSLNETMSIVGKHELSLEEMIETMNSNLNEITVFVKDIIDKTHDDHGAVKDMHHTCDVLNQSAQGNFEVSQTVYSIVSDNHDVLININEKAKNVESIIDMIASISNQVDLLSLNASIEAARASEAGRGFMVVANEIKNLSSQTQLATQNINTVVKELVSAIFDLQKSMKTIQADSKKLLETSQVSLESFDKIYKTSESLFGSFSMHKESTDLLDEKSLSVENLLNRTIEQTVLLSESLRSSESAVKNNEVQIIELKEILKQIG